QRVAIARSLITSPEILLFDEPFSALYAFTKVHSQDLLLVVWESYHYTMLLVTHDDDEAFYLCDRMIILCVLPRAIDKEIRLAEPRTRKRGSRKSAEFKTEILYSLNLIGGDEHVYSK